ncbi:probable strigolactone esterase d14 [Phtheirospermum japonicum]|uniref:Probable strigolactone esterase d14 n=1 Tax=Phtheirospermum japonicum TaxID=374723 RepID=A0A830BFT2_9LAMI|nr:probable strigolactone esterase d14 [Phtheirospermum japonicum]
MAAFANECVGGLAAALNAHTYGNGSQTIVLSHGYGTDQSVWHYILPVLAIYFKVLVYDLAFSPNVNPKLYDPVRYSNYGAYAQDLTSVLDELKVKDSIFVGHSMSAMIGGIAATRRPDLFRHLVWLNGSPRYLNDTGYNGGSTRVQLDSIFNSIKTNYAGWVQSFVPAAIGVNNTAAIEEFKSSLLRWSPQVALQTARAVFLKDYRRVLPYVHVPSTIIQSKEDIIVPKSVAYYIKRKLGAPARVRVLKTKGHFPHLTVPSRLLRVLKKIKVCPFIEVPLEIETLQDTSRACTIHRA